MNTKGTSFSNTNKRKSLAFLSEYYTVYPTKRVNGIVLANGLSGTRCISVSTVYDTLSRYLILAQKFKLEDFIQIICEEA